VTHTLPTEFSIHHKILISSPVFPHLKLIWPSIILWNC
jgi:hypothetical protein